MDSEDTLVAFQGKQIRRTWHDNQRHFSVVDVMSVLPDSPTPRTYWGKPKTGHPKQRELSLGPSTTEIAITGWQALLQQTFANT
ncbi:MAG: hypothetical protein C5S48_07230 [Candidatus Methanogaster sp.]|nr:MAG: hypothetical protein C5S48_07230 [ANME-2 cluster archaeon]